MAVSFIGHINRIPETKIPKSFKIKEVIRSRKSKKDRKRANTDVQNNKRHLNAEQHEPH
jgi:hypothetical protein